MAATVSAMAAGSAGALLLANADLAAEWRKLVAAGAIAATAKLADGCQVRYGIRLDPDAGYCQWVSGDEGLKRAMADGGAQRVVNTPDGFCAQLQLIRTLRPPPTANLQTFPPYDAASDSFVTGELRLQLRPRTASVEVGRTSRRWDVYHNVSPCDPRGHFLLLPTIDDEANWRRQALTADDCADFVWLARRAQRTASAMPTATSSGAEGLLLCFNGIRAGASQNHVHCHAWPAPPGGITSSRYAIQSAALRGAASTLRYGAGLEVALLEYPVACVRLRTLSDSGVRTPWTDVGDVTSSSVNGVADASDDEGGLALALVLSALDARSYPFNVVALDGDVWVFARSSDGERAATFPTLKLGSSEMAGYFHCQARIRRATQPTHRARPMDTALACVGDDCGRVRGSDSVGTARCITCLPREFGDCRCADDCLQTVQELEVASRLGAMAEALASISAPHQAVWEAISLALCS